MSLVKFRLLPKRRKILIISIVILLFVGVGVGFAVYKKNSVIKWEEIKEGDSLEEMSKLTVTPNSDGSEDSELSESIDSDESETTTSQDQEGSEQSTGTEATSQEEVEEEEDDDEEIDTTPVLKNLIVDFAPYNGGTGRAGSFLFELSEDKVFLEFGAVVDESKVLPTFEYRVVAGSSVYAAADAYILSVVYQAVTADYEISTALDMIEFDYVVSYDHIKNPTVSMGDWVTAGTVLGTAGTWSATLGRTELMVIGDFTPTGNTAFCPFSFFDPSLKITYMNKVTQHMSDWEAFKSDTGIYDQGSMVAPGCNAWTY